MSIAVRQAEIALSKGTLPVGAVLLHNGEVIAVSHKTELDHYMGHAELVLLQNAFRGREFVRGDNLHLYTTLEPCVMCWGAILHHPIDAVTFAIEDPWGGGTEAIKRIDTPRHKGKIPSSTGGILWAESAALLRQFAVSRPSEFWEKRGNVFLESFLDADLATVDHFAQGAEGQLAP